MTTETVANVHEELARERKIAACLAALDRRKNEIGSDDRKLLQFVASMDDAAWNQLARDAGTHRLSETTRDQLVERLRGRLPS